MKVGFLVSYDMFIWGEIFWTFRNQNTFTKPVAYISTYQQFYKYTWSK